MGHSKSKSCCTVPLLRLFGRQERLCVFKTSDEVEKTVVKEVRVRRGGEVRWWKGAWDER